MTVLERILAVAVLFLCVVLYMEWQHATNLRIDLSNEKARSEVLLKTINADRAAYAAKDKALAALKAAQATRQGELNAAVKANSEWAANRVPDAVYDSLFKQSPGYSPK